jgi:hypothetical protein
MRLVVTCLGLSGLVLLFGCNNTRVGVINRGPDPRATGPGQPPSVAALVEYMESNSRLVQGLRCDNVTLTINAGIKSLLIPDVDAMLACERPRKFRMTGQVLGHDEVDIGSNDQEFWFWIKRDNPPTQWYCSYQDLAEGRVRHMPFPFQPEWVAETLGMGNYGPPERYEQRVAEEGNSFKLIERVRGPQGKPLRKVIVFHKWKAEGNRPQITDYLLLDDATGKEICAAHITEVQGDPGRGIVPRKVELRWPEAKLRLTMRLNGVKLNPQMPPALFVRQRLQGVPSVDLATLRPEGQMNALQRTGGRGPSR